MPKILYIAGDGRSGSTFLSIVLDNHPQIVAGGELSFLLDDWENEQRVCSCGERYCDCESWRGLFSEQDPSVADKAVIRRVECLANLPRLLWGRINKQDRQLYSNIQRKLFAHMEAVSGASVAVDASKSARAAAGRAIALHKIAGFDVYVLHLVRDGVATMESAVLKGSNWQMEEHIEKIRWPALRSAIGWVLANLAAGITRRVVGKDRYLRLHYDTLVKEPAASLRQISEFCGCPADELIQRINSAVGYQVGHMTGGNRVRFQKQVWFRHDGLRTKQTKLSRAQVLLFQIVGGWLNRHYRSAVSKPNAS